MIDRRAQQFRHALHEQPTDPLGRRLLALGKTQADVVHLHDQGHHAVHDDGDHDGDDDEDDRPLDDALVEHLLERDHHDLCREDEVGADRAADRLGFGVGALHHRRQLVGLVSMVADPVVELLGPLEAEVRAADHQDDLDQHRRDGAEDQCRRQDEEDLVAERAGGDLADDRQLAVSGEPANVRRRDGGIVDDHPGGLRARPPGGGADVVDRRRGQLGQRGDIIE